MRTAVFYIVVCVICASTSFHGPGADTTVQDDNKAAIEKQKAESVDRVRGMKAAVSDIAEGRIWVLSAARACSCPSDAESALQLALKAELKISADYELIDGRWPSIVEKQYIPFVSHAALKGYNDVMWTEIEHRHGKEARQRVEKRASQMEPTLRNEK